MLITKKVIGMVVIAVFTNIKCRDSGLKSEDKGQKFCSDEMKTAIKKLLFYVSGTKNRVSV